MKTKEVILVISKSEKICDTLTRSLGPEYKIDFARSVRSALDMVKDKGYTVVITEIDIPELKGVEVLHKLKEAKSDVPIVVITTHNSVQLAVEAMKAGAYDYITKPFNLEELKLIIHHASEWHKLTEEVKEKRIFQELALLDGLTGIYNRRYFDELLRREAERANRYQQNFALLMIDIDDFKRYNDTYGHLAGDVVIKDVANILVHKTRSTDFVARYGGEEFTIIAPHTKKEFASVMAARIVHGIAAHPFHVSESVTTSVTVSVGLASFGEDASTKEELAKCADEALYQAKRLGKNRVCMLAE